MGGGGKEWSDSAHILKTEPTGLPGEACGVGGRWSQVLLECPKRKPVLPPMADKKVDGSKMGIQVEAC